MLKFTENNQIIGVLLVEKEQELYLGMLTVSPELQNSGLGKNYCNRQKFMHSIGPAQIVMTVISPEELIAWYKRRLYSGEKEPFQ
jgi:ribosomal protein S18 acetylase RimI-like enzyme